jgi:hypothetical protein
MFFVDERSLEEVVEPVKPCNCHGTGQSTKHDWTVFKGMAHGVWYISYTEHSECPLPTLPQLALDRVPFESKWPCYDSLSNLDMRILRQLTFPDVQYRLRRSRLS